MHSYMCMGTVSLPFTLVRETGQTFRTGSTNYNKLSKSLHEKSRRKAGDAGHALLHVYGDGLSSFYTRKRDRTNF